MADVYSFGRFVLESEPRRLYADGVPVPLGSTDMRLLTALVKRAGSTVPKNDLIAHVWGHAAVTDNALYVHINALRRAIGEDCIVNKQGHGYRFVAQIHNAPKSLSLHTVQRRRIKTPASRALTSYEALPLIGRRDEGRLLSKLLARK